MTPKASHRKNENLFDQQERGRPARKRADREWMRWRTRRPRSYFQSRHEGTKSKKYF
jgi:hypothetical protein